MAFNRYDSSDFYESTKQNPTLTLPEHLERREEKGKDIGKLIQFHKAQGTLATVTSVQPLGRFEQRDIPSGARITHIAF